MFVGKRFHLMVRIIRSKHKSIVQNTHNKAPPLGTSAGVKVVFILDFFLEDLDLEGFGAVDNLMVWL